MVLVYLLISCTWINQADSSPKSLPDQFCLHCHGHGFSLGLLLLTQAAAITVPWSTWPWVSLTPSCSLQLRSLQPRDSGVYTVLSSSLDSSAVNNGQNVVVWNSSFSLPCPTVFLLFLIFSSFCAFAQNTPPSHSSFSKWLICIFTLAQGPSSTGGVDGLLRGGSSWPPNEHVWVLVSEIVPEVRQYVLP